MRLEEILKDLGEEGAAEALRPGWEESQACFPAETPAFLDKGQVAERCAYGGFDEAGAAAAQAAAEAARGDERLRRLAWHCMRLLFDSADYPSASMAAWPSLSGRLGDLGGAFYMPVALEAIPRARAFHAGRGVPEDVTRHTCSDVRILAERYLGLHGRWGMPVDVLGWLRNHASGAIYRLGRHQYVQGAFRHPMFVFRRKGGEETLALADAGVRFTDEGFLPWMGETLEPAQGWTSEFRMDATEARGTILSPLGMALRRQATVRLSEWDLVLQKGTPVLQMHIPRGDSISVEATAASLAQAEAFFPRYFPDRPFRAFACASWMFNTQLVEMLGPEANMPRWQREVYLFPTESDGTAGVYFVFGVRKLDVSTAPRDTRLRRAMVDKLASGGKLRSGGMFLLREDLGRFGGQVYRRGWE
ncbi:MAG TPA: acyltransferase domain-containing protein [Candidatus Brocadiia bacterium]|nr:acyltransferase domain-containing protein [Candidatus Brocadiia bacterium]